MIEITTAPIVIEPLQTANCAVIWLHGLGANGHDFVSLVPALQLPEDHRMRFVFPHAPIQPVTLNGGMHMPAWFDVLGLDRTSTIDTNGILAAMAYTESLIAEQNALGIQSKHIVLAGFSQGGAVVLHTALNHAEPLAGVIGLSTYLPMVEALNAGQYYQASKSLAMLLVHGIHDSLVTLDLARSSCALLQQLGFEPQWKTYPMQHEVCLEEISLIAQWLQRVS